MKTNFMSFTALCLKFCFGFIVAVRTKVLKELKKVNHL